MVRHTLQVLGPKVLASRMVRDYTEKYYAPAAQSLHRTIEAGRQACRSAPPASWPPTAQRVHEAWPKIQITDVDSYGLPDTPLLGSELTLTATVHLAGLRPDEVVVQAVVGRVDASDALVDPETVPMAHTGTADGGNEMFSTTTPLPVAGPVGYTVRVLPHHPLLAGRQRTGPRHAGVSAPRSGRRWAVSRRARPVRCGSHAKRRFVRVPQRCLAGCGRSQSDRRHRWPCGGRCGSPCGESVAGSPPTRPVRRLRRRASAPSARGRTGWRLRTR